LDQHDRARLDTVTRGPSLPDGCGGVPRVLLQSCRNS